MELTRVILALRELAESLEEIQETTVPVVNGLDAKETTTLDAGQLQELKYTELRELAKEIGLPISGTKAELVERISNAEVDIEVALAEEVEIKKPLEVVSVEEEEEEKEDYEEDEEDEEKSGEPSLEDTLEEMTNEELADLLDSVGVSPKGKRQALLDKVIKAVEDGLLVFEDPDEDEEVEEYEDTEEMTPERRATIDKVRTDITALYKAKQITDTSILERLKEVKLEIPKDKRERLDLFKKVYANLVDDSGVQNDMQEPYVINGEYHCCSVKLELNDDENLECDICGTEYETE